MKNTTFKRKELKYLIDDYQREMLIERLNSVIIEDEFTKYTICNIYYDNKYYDSYNQSVERVSFKEKIRERSYLNDSDYSNHYIESKKKYQGVTYKRRVSYFDKDSQVAKEIQWTIENYQFKPILFISYFREAFVVENIRLTFDKDIKYRNEDIKNINKNYGKQLLPPYTNVMEIKTESNYPIWFTAILSDLGIYPCSFSKYKQCFEESFKGGLINNGTISTNTAIK